jgi:hypothetical protein
VTEDKNRINVGNVRFVENWAMDKVPQKIIFKLDGVDTMNTRHWPRIQNFGRRNFDEPGD